MNKTRRIIAILSLVGAILSLSGVSIASAQVTYVGEPPMHRGGSSVYPGGYSGSPYYATNYNNYGYYGSGQGSVLTFTSNPVTVAYVGVLYTYRPTVNSVSGILPTIALENGPAGMYMDGTGLINWIPDASQLGQTFQISLSARDPYSPARTFHNYFVTVGVYQQAQSTTGSTGGSTSGTATPGFLKSTQGTQATTASYTYRRSPIATLFGFGSDTTDDLEIANVVAQGGPVNLYDDQPNTNCSVVVSWETNLPTAGQVVYGTKSQPSDSFAYDFTAAETVSTSKSHRVQLQCLTNEVYYFRVVSFSENQRAVTEEMTIFPFKIDGVLASGTSRPSASVGSGLASVFGTATRFFVNPFVLILLLVIATIIIINVFTRRSNVLKKGQPAVSAEPVEPTLFIPTAPNELPEA